MRNWRITLLIGSLLALGVLAAWRVQAVSSAREEAEAIVRRALTVKGQLSYTGRKVSRFPDPVSGKLVESEALVARRPPSLLRIQYVTPPLAGVTRWYTEKEVYRYDPATNELEIYDRSSRRGEAGGQEGALVLSNYEPRLEGQEIVAGRTAFRVRLAPRNPGDDWKRLWLDKETFLKLAQEDFDGKDRLIRRTRFVEVAFNQLAPEEFRPPAQVIQSARKTYSDEERPRSVQRVSSILGIRIKLPAFIPKGYRLKGAYTYPCECGCDQPAAQVRWTNGLNTISMFQCGHPCGNGAPCTFPTEPQSASVPISVGEESFLFVGDTARANLQKMADSLKATAARQP